MTLDASAQKRLNGMTALVVGAGRGFGRGVAEALAAAGAAVVAIARTESDLAQLAEQTPEVHGETADAADPAVAAKLLSQYRPGILVLAAGATPPIGPIHELSWESFSANWQTDVQLTFAWLGEALRLPLSPGARVVVFSSGAALRGSPLSGGYAGAKATQRFLAAYAQEESNRARLDLRVTTVMPQLTSATTLGRSGVEAYARRAGITAEQFQQQLGKPLTPATAGAAVTSLITTESTAPAYLLTAAGLRPVD